MTRGRRADAPRPRSDEWDDESEKRDAADQEASAPLLQLAAMGGKNIRDRGREAADRDAGKTDEWNGVHHLCPRRTKAPQRAFMHAQSENLVAARLRSGDRGGATARRRPPVRSR